MKIRSKQKWQLQSRDKEKITGESQTVPDDGFTVKELLQKHIAGIPLGIQRLGQWENLEEDEHDAIDMEKFQQLEETEKREIIAENVQLLHRTKERKKAIDEVKKAEKEKKSTTEKTEAD